MLTAACAFSSQAITPPPKRDRYINILWILHELHSYKKCHKKMNQNSNLEGRKLVLDAITACLQQIRIFQLLNQLSIFTKCDKNIRPLKSTQTSYFPISYCQMMDDNRPQTNIRLFTFFLSPNLKQYGGCVKYIFSFQSGGDNYGTTGGMRNFIWRHIINIPTNIYIRSRKPRLMAMGICCADHATPSTRKSWH
jgi:hypothetical protein